MSLQNDTASTGLETVTKQIQGRAVPALGFGTYELGDEDCRQAVLSALETGYRHVDTARMYGNEALVGRGIAESGVPRKELFVTSKIWRDALDPIGVEREIETSLNLLKLDYLDLILIHWPNQDLPLEQTLRAMLEQVEKGRVRHVGVSNFPPKLFKEALAYAPIFCNQVEYHPFLDQRELVGIARSHDVLLTAYSPLAQGKVADCAELVKIGNKYGKNPQQVALRWLIEQDQVAAIPRSSTPAHIASNFDIFDFQLDEDDRRAIDSLPKDRRLVDPEFAPDWERD